MEACWINLIETQIIKFTYSLFNIFLCVTNFCRLDLLYVFTFYKTAKLNLSWKVLALAGFSESKDSIRWILTSVRISRWIVRDTILKPLVRNSARDCKELTSDSSFYSPKIWALRMGSTKNLGWRKSKLAVAR